MYDIFLINMPFAALNMPSLALTQIKSVVERQYPEQVSAQVFYLNQDFESYMGFDLYDEFGGSMKHHSTGLGDWFFRQAAFPELNDNSQQYFLRYYPRQDPESRRFKQLIEQKRQGLDRFLDSLIDRYGLAQAQLVGFSSMFSQSVACYAMARKLKERNPAITIVIGGANCESPMGQEIIKHVNPIDFVFSGPALKSFSDFVGYQLTQQEEKCHQIDGVFSRQNLSLLRSSMTPPGLITLGESATIGTLGLELDVNVRVPLDYDPFLELIEQNYSDKQLKPALLFETSRGCWWGERAHCTFCGLNGLTMNYRMMTPQNALEQFDDLFKYADGGSEISLECVDNILPKEYFKQVLPHIETPEEMTIFYEVKANLSEEDVKALANARVKLIQPGIEALATSTLKLMRKGSSAFVNLNLLKHCAIYDVFPVWNLLVGFPGEKAEVYQKYVRDIPLLIHLPPPSGAYPVRFDRYSPYFTQAEEYGLDLQHYDYYELIYSFSKESLANLAYYFTDQTYNASYLLDMAGWIGKVNQKIEEWKSRWYSEEPRLRPHLFFEETPAATWIYDSRFGEMQTYQISEVSKQVLKRLTRPASLPQLAKHMPEIDAEKEIAFLQKNKFLFEEKNRFMSLVLPHKPPTSFRQKAVELAPAGDLWEEEEGEI